MGFLAFTDIRYCGMYVKETDTDSQSNMYFVHEKTQKNF